MSERERFDHWKVIDILGAVCFMSVFMASAFGVKINEEALMIGLPAMMLYGIIRLSSM